VNPSRTWAIAKKEFFHIYRDPRSLALVILMPALLMLLFGYAVTLDVKNVSMAVLDRDRTQESLNFIQRFSASPYFSLRFWVRDEKEMRRLIDQGEVKMGLVIPWDFSKTVKADKVAPVQALIDGADGVLIGGCHPGDCHYQTGNFKARRRVAILKGILTHMGFTQDRIWLKWISASEGKLFADTVTKMVEELKKMGPNPMKQLWNA